MKVLVNGGINFSELDGWWAEAYMPDVGWALGDGQVHDDEPGWDAAEAEMLYDQLEHEVIPEFYSRDENGIPVAWVARMRESMARLTPQYCSTRTVQEYTEQHYLPAAENYLSRAADNGALGVRVVKWQHALDQKWPTLRFGEVKVETDRGQHLFEVQVYLEDLDPNAVRVELYVDAIGSGMSIRQEMKKVRELAGTGGGYAYSASVSAARPPEDYTPRMIASSGEASLPLEAPWILWQR